MATKELIYNGFSYEEDLVFIPIITPLLKKLHLIFPTMFTPFVLKHHIVFLSVCLLITIIVLILQCIFTALDAIPVYEKDILETDFRDFFGSKNLSKRKFSDEGDGKLYEKVSGSGEEKISELGEE